MAEEVVAIRLSALGAAEVEGAMNRAGRAVGTLNTRTAATREGVTKAGNAIVNLATQSVGATGPIGRLAEGVGLMGLGGPLVTAVAAGIAIIYGAYRILGKDALAAAKQQDELTDALARQAKDGIPAAVKSVRDLNAAMREFEQASELVSRNQSVIDFLNRFGGGDNGDPIARGLSAIVGGIGRLPRGRQRTAATAVNQGQINQQQALADLYVREAQLIAETIEVRGRNTESVRRAAAMQAFLTAEAQKSNYTIPQQNALLKAAGTLTDAITEKKTKQATTTRALADVERDRTNVLLELLKLEAPTPERWSELRARAESLSEALAAGNVPLGERVALLRELRAIEAATGFSGDLPVDPIGRRGAQRPPLRGIAAPIDDPAAGLSDDLFDGGNIGDRMRRSLVEAGQTAEDAAANVADQFHAAGQSLGASFESGIVGAFESIGRGGGIGQALAGFAGSMLSALGGMAIKFGIAAAKIGALMEKAMKALASLNPILAIGAGIALVALGSALGGAASSSFGGSGGGSGGSLTPINVTYRVPSSNLTQPANTPAAPSGPPVSVTYYGGKDPKFERWLTERIASAQGRGL